MGAPGGVLDLHLALGEGGTAVRTRSARLGSSFAVGFQGSKSLVKARLEVRESAFDSLGGSLQLGLTPDPATIALVDVESFVREFLLAAGARRHCFSK